MINFNLEEDFFDKDFIKELNVKLIDMYGLNNYVDKINIIDGYHKKNCASYYPNEKEINIYLKSVYESFYRYITQYLFLINEKEQNRRYGLYLLQIMLHELMHAKQAKLSCETNNDSLHILVKEGIELGRRCPNNLTLREQILYSLFHDRILTEKNANCNSIKELIEVNNMLDFLSKEELIMYKVELEKNLNYGYTTKSAAENYYILRGKEKEYKKISFTETYDEYTRRSWGMPL
jgi:hypothetical protein